MDAEDKKQVNKCLYSSFDALLNFIFCGGKKKSTPSLISSPDRRKKESRA